MKTLNIFAFADEASQALAGQIDAMKRNGLNGLEIRNLEAGNVSDLSDVQAREARKILEGEGLSVWSIGSPIGKIDIVSGDYKAHLEKFRHTLEIANILGAENLRMFSFYIPRGEASEKYKNEVMDRLGEMVEIAQGSGIVLCHENEKGIYGDNAGRCLEILREFPSIKGIFDPANFIQCGQEIPGAWQQLAPYIKYLHIKDALPDGSVVPAGHGEGHLAEILADFIERGGTAVTIEPHLAVFDGFSGLERAGEKSNLGKYTYPSSDAAFDAACNALKEILCQIK